MQGSIHIIEVREPLKDWAPDPASSVFSDPSEAESQALEWNADFPHLEHRTAEFLPSDQSPIPALTKALKAYQAAAESWHDFHHGSTIVQCDAICALIPEGKAVLALVEAK